MQKYFIYFFLNNTSIALVIDFYSIIYTIFTIINIKPFVIFVSNLFVFLYLISFIIKNIFRNIVEDYFHTFQI